METDSVVVIVAEEQEPECIICLEPKNLIVNTRCSCIYSYHAECMKKTERPTCLLCNKSIDGQMKSQGIQTESQDGGAEPPRNSICSCICCGLIGVFVPAIWFGVNFGMLK
jgi:hypothetical protein